MSVNVFSTKVLIGDTIFTSSPGLFPQKMGGASNYYKADYNVYCFEEQHFNLWTGLIFFPQTESLFTSYNISAGYTSLPYVNRCYWIYDRN